MDVAWRIKELIRQSGLSQVEIADKIGFSQQYISAVANGKKIPLDNLEKLCAGFNITISEFFQPFSTSEYHIPPYLQEFVSLCSDLAPEDVQLLSDAARHIKALRQSAASPVVVAETAQQQPRRTPGGPAPAKEPAAPDDVWKPILGDAAAGYDGVYRPADDGDRVLVPTRYAAEEYYVIRAFGHSMEPGISNGGCVVVHKDAPPSNGDLALIRKRGMADHELMIKKYYKEGKNVRLVSANPNFDDIVLPLSAIALCERVVYIVRSEP